MQEQQLISSCSTSKCNQNTENCSSSELYPSTTTQTYWYLVRKGYTKKNSSFLLRHDHSSFFYVGRGPDCDFQCKAGNISRIHFKLICEKSKVANNKEDAQWSIQDLGSLAGTYLNGKKLCQDMNYLLLEDDVISLGKDIFALEKVPNDKYTFVYQVLKNKAIHD